MSEIKAFDPAQKFGFSKVKQTEITDGANRQLKKIKPPDKRQRWLDNFLRQGLEFAAQIIRENHLTDIHGRLITYPDKRKGLVFVIYMAWAGDVLRDEQIILSTLQVLTGPEAESQIVTSDSQFLDKETGHREA